MAFCREEIERRKMEFETEDDEDIDEDEEDDIDGEEEEDIDEVRMKFNKITKCVPFVSILGV